MKKIIISFLLLTMISLAAFAQENLLYLKRGNPSGWTVEGASGSQYKEISEWEDAGYSVTTLNLSETVITEDLLSDYDVLRFNGYGGGGRNEFSAYEGEAIYNWVMAGGKCLANGCWSRFNPLFTDFGIEKVSQHDTWQGFPYHGAPFNISPVTGPVNQVNVLAIEAMDQPELAADNTLTIDADVSGYPSVMHGEFGSGKVVFTLNEGWSHDKTYNGNAYRSDIYHGDNLQFLGNVIIYFENSTGVFNEQKLFSDVEIYPNPASIEFCIEISSLNNSTFYLKLFDIAGRQIIKQLLESKKTTINISDLKKGVYIIRITSQKGVILSSKRLIKN